VRPQVAVHHDSHLFCYFNVFSSIIVLVRLVGGWTPREGRLEILHNGVWGTVCDDGFTDDAARVVCYSIGFGYVLFTVHLLLFLLLIDRAIRRNWVMLYWLVDKYRMTQ